MKYERPPYTVRLLTRKELKDGWEVIFASGVVDERVCRRLSSLMRQKNCIALLAEERKEGPRKRKVGLLLAEKLAGAVHIRFIGVRSLFQYAEVACELLAKLQEGTCGSVTRIFVYLKENEEKLRDAFRACGYRAELVRDFYGGGKDAYLMSKAVGVRLPPTHRFHPRNRLIRRTSVEELLGGRRREM